MVETELRFAEELGTDRILEYDERNYNIKQIQIGQMV